MAHTLKETIELAIKNTILRMHPIGKLWLTLGDENPSTIVGGGVGENKHLCITVFK